MMETDGESHSQTLGELTEEQEEGLQKPEGSGVARGKTTKNRQIWVYRDSKRLNQQAGTLNGPYLGPLHVCYGCVAWWFCGTPNKENGGCF